MYFTNCLNLLNRQRNSGIFIHKREKTSILKGVTDWNLERNRSRGRLKSGWKVQVKDSIEAMPMGL